MVRVRKLFKFIRPKNRLVRLRKDPNRLSIGSNTKNTVIYLLRGAYTIDLTKVDSTFTKLHKACYLNRDIKKIRKYLGHGCNPNQIDNVASSCPLHLVTVNGNLDAIKLLIETGADPNMQDGDGKTPLMKAIECFRHNCVKFFILQGCDLNLTDYQQGNTALHLAILNNYSLACLSLLKYSQKMNVHVKNFAGETALHLIVKFPDLHKFIPDILDNGGNISLEDSQRRTPLVLAYEMGYYEAARMMINHPSSHHLSQDRFSISTDDSMKIPFTYLAPASSTDKMSLPSEDNSIKESYIRISSEENLPSSTKSSIISSSPLPAKSPDCSSVSSSPEPLSPLVKPIEKERIKAIEYRDSQTAPFLGELIQIRERCRDLREKISQEKVAICNDINCILVSLREDISFVKIKLII